MPKLLSSARAAKAGQSMAFAGISTVGQGFAYAAAGLYILSMVVSLLAQVRCAALDIVRRVRRVSQKAAACARP